MNLASAFAASVHKHLEKTALFWGNRTYTYTELWSKSLFITGILRQQYGISPGDRVGLWLKNCPEFVPGLFGILHAGAVVVPINNFFKPDEVGFILNDADIDVVITDADLHVLGATTLRPPFGLFDWYLKPHLDSPDFPGRNDAWAEGIAAKADFPIYFIDDATAIRVDGDEVDVVSEGRWQLLP